MEIQLTQGKIALIDDGDHPIVAPYKWCAVHTGHRFYAVAYINGKYVYMHRLLMGVTDPTVKVDHINHDGLDNRRSANLRLCSNAENMRNRVGPPKHNTTGFVGVYENQGRYVAKIWTNQRSKYLGSFPTKEEAARARDAAAMALHGDFASLNFPHLATGEL